MINIADRALEAGIKKLETRIVGGYSPKSTKEALEAAISIIEKEYSKANAILNKDLSDAQEALAKAKIEMEKLTAAGIGTPRKLANGNIETRKILKDAMGIVEKTPEGKKVYYEVVTTNGDLRRVYFDPKTEKPIKSFHRFSKGEDKPAEEYLIKYSPNGYEIHMINSKKVSVKPWVTSRFEIEAKDGNRIYKELFSDGSYKLTTFNKNQPEEPIAAKLFDSKNRLLEEYEMYEGKTLDNQHFIRKVTSKYDSESGKVKEITVLHHNIGENEKDHVVIKSIYDNDQCCELIKTFSDGTKCIMKADKNEFGLYNDICPTMEYIYPKSSKIKKSKTYFSAIYVPEKEEILLKDGTKVTATVSSKNYYVTKLEITNKNGEQKLITDLRQCEEYLKEQGYIGFNPKYNSRDKYYCNNMYGQ